MLSKPEIDLFRLLKSTEALVEEALSRRETANISLRTFQKYVEALVLRHSQLEHVRDTSTNSSNSSAATPANMLAMPDQSSANAPSSEAIADFKRRIEFLKRVVYSDEFKTALNPIVITQPEPQPHSLALSDGPSTSFIKTALNSEARRQLGLDEEVTKPSSEEQRPSSAHTTPTKLPTLVVSEQGSSSSFTALQSERSSSISSTGPRTPKKLGGNVGSKALLDHHKQVQEDYTDEMLEFTQKLKENAIATSKIVSHQLGTLDKLDTKLENNSDAASLANQALSELFESSSGSTWFHWSIMMTATLMFAGMYLFMKLFPKIPSE